MVTQPVCGKVKRGKTKGPSTDPCGPSYTHVYICLEGMEKLFLLFDTCPSDRKKTNPEQQQKHHTNSPACRLVWMIDTVKRRRQIKKRHFGPCLEKWQ